MKEKNTPFMIEYITNIRLAVTNDRLIILELSTNTSTSSPMNRPQKAIWLETMA